MSAAHIELLEIAALEDPLPALLTSVVGRLFEPSGDAYEVSTVAPCASAQTMLAFAAYVGYLDGYARSLTKYRPDILTEAREQAYGLSFSLHANWPQRGFRLVGRVAAVPSGVMQRQDLFRAIGTAFEAILDVHRLWDRPSVVQDLVIESLRGMPRSTDDEASLEALVGGNHDRLAVEKRQLVALAAVLDPRIVAMLPPGYELQLGPTTPQERKAAAG